MFNHMSYIPYISFGNQPFQNGPTVFNGMTKSYTDYIGIKGLRYTSLVYQTVLTKYHEIRFYL